MRCSYISVRPAAILSLASEWKINNELSVEAYPDWAGEMHPSIGLLPPPGEELPVEGFRKMLTQIKLQLVSRFHVVSYNSPMTQTLTPTDHFNKCIFCAHFWGLAEKFSLSKLKFDSVLPGGWCINITVHSEHVKGNEVYQTNGSTNLLYIILSFSFDCCMRGQFLFFFLFFLLGGHNFLHCTCICSDGPIRDNNHLWSFYSSPQL